MPFLKVWTTGWRRYICIWDFIEVCGACNDHDDSQLQPDEYSY